MADKNSGWKCTHSVTEIENTNAYRKLRVTCYWQNNNWDYNISNVSSWVYCGGQSAKVKDNGKVNNDGQGLYATTTMGYHDFIINKTKSNQSVSCYGKITSNSSYVSGTKSSSATSESISAKPSYSVSYNANGGWGAPSGQTKWHNEKLTLQSSSPSRDGHTFLGWSTSASGAVAYSPGSIYSGNANLTLYAKWQVHTYAVKYNANGGSGAPVNQTKTYGVNLTLSSTKPTRTNYNFLGWSTSPNGGVNYNSGSTYSNNSEITLYAVWQLAYVKPRLNNFKAYRCTSDGTASEEGTYIKVIFDWAYDKTINAIGVYLNTTPYFSSSNWHGFTISGKSGSVNKIIGDGNIDVETSYYIKARLSDTGGTTDSNMITIGTIKFPIDVKSGGKGIAVGKVAEYEDIFDIDLITQHRKNVEIISKIGESRLYKVQRPDGSVSIQFGIGSSDKRGIWDANIGDWLLYLDTNTDFYINKKTNIKGAIHSTGSIISDGHLQGGFIELNGYPPFIDFHNNNSSADYTTRLIEWDPGVLTCTGSLKIKDSIAVLGCKTLYINSSGTSGTVTLTDTADNWTYMDICYKNSDGQVCSTGKIVYPNGKTINASISRMTSDGNNIMISSALFNINGTTITISRNSQVNASTSEDTLWLDSTNVISIICVDVWKV